MIATGHTLASAAGVEVLAAGGNAVDAAIAAAAVLGVVQPMMSGLGGDTFMLVYRRREDRLYGLNASGPAPAGATREYFVERGHVQMPLRGMLSVSVPGAVAAMETALDRWGSGRFGLQRLLDPAIRYAEEGAPVARRVAHWMREVAPVLGRYPSSAAIFLPGGRAPEEGDILVQRDLARSLRTVAAGGAKAFYRGPLARAMGEYSLAHGGLLSAEDLAGYQAEVYEPLRGSYRHLTVYATAPPSQAFLLLEMLNILEDFPPAPWGSPDAVHRGVEAKKLAFADRLAYLGDPRFVRNPLDRLLDKTYAATRRREIDPGRAAEAPRGGLAEVPGDTTYLCVADVEGNLVSYITSLSAAFGCGEVVEGTGIMLNNRAGRGFELVAGHPNCIAPGKRTMHTLVAYMAFRGGAVSGLGNTRWRRAAPVESPGAAQPGGRRDGCAGGDRGPALAELPGYRSGAPGAGLRVASGGWIPAGDRGRARAPRAPHPSRQRARGRGRGAGHHRRPRPGVVPGRI
jgi:gamma-glutamyltranspeptidase/glutathione hydrolase